MKKEWGSLLSNMLRSSQLGNIFKVFLLRTSQNLKNATKYCESPERRNSIQHTLQLFDQGILS